MKPTPEQLRDYFKSEVFHSDHLIGSDYDQAIAEFYHRFYPESDFAKPVPNPRKWQTTIVRKYSVKAFLRTKDGNIHYVIFKQGSGAHQILNFDGSAWEGDPNSLDVWQEYYESDQSFELRH